MDCFGKENFIENNYISRIDARKKMLNGKRRKMIQRTIKLHTGVEKTLNSTKIITKTEWQKAAEKLYGSDVKQWRFKCPICGHTASVQEIPAYGFLGIPYGGYVIEDKNGIGMEIFEFADKVETN